VPHEVPVMEPQGRGLHHQYGNQSFFRIEPKALEPHLVRWEGHLGSSRKSCTSRKSCRRFFSMTTE
jgi:hypothetical protein